MNCREVPDMMALEKVKNLELKYRRNSDLRSVEGQFSGFFTRMTDMTGVQEPEN
jgi:hypothetical protein